MKIIKAYDNIVDILQNHESIHKYEYQVKKFARLKLILLFGSNDSDVDIKIDIKEKYASAYIYGLVIGKSAHKISLNTYQHHSAPHTKSKLVVKSVLSDQSFFTYHGKIRVEKSAQKTDAYQSNNNLILSRSCHVKSQPILEIEADDIICTHSATISSIDKLQKLYLSSRGIKEKSAENLIVNGFINYIYSVENSSNYQLQIKDFLAKNGFSV